MTRKYFGTDGIRGKVGQFPITPEFVMKLGWAAGTVFKSHAGSDEPLILIGKDTRVSGYMFESALESGLIAAGVNVGLLGPMPTPAIAYLSRTFRATAGIVISASHNPFGDNGIKFFAGDGYKLDDALEMEIEALLDKDLKMVEARDLGKATRMEDVEGRYIEFCKGTLPNTFDLSGMKIVVDCAHGATYRVGPRALMELRADVTTIADKPDGFNINKECGSTHPQILQQKVLELGADLGIAFDGDGDRVMFVDNKGELVDGDELIYIIASHRVARGKKCQGVVGTLMTNLGLELKLNDLGIPFERAKVGDRYVIEALNRNGWMIGGENSGHIICKHLNTTGDGIVAALQVLRAVSESGLSLHELKSGMQKFPQVMINVAKKIDVDVMADQEVKARINEAEARLAGKGRVLLRPSGTEPLVRVMVEGEDQALVQKTAENIAELVSQKLAG